MKNANAKNERPEGFVSGLTAFDPNNVNLFYQDALRQYLLTVDATSEHADALPAVSVVLSYQEVDGIPALALAGVMLFGAAYANSQTHSEAALVRNNFERFHWGDMIDDLVDSDYFREFQSPEEIQAFVAGLNKWQEALAVSAVYAGLLRQTPKTYEAEKSTEAAGVFVKSLKYCSTASAMLASLQRQFSQKA